MKKAIVLMSAMTLFTFTSCKKEKVETSTDNTSTNAPATTGSATATTIAGVPDFDDPKLDEYVSSYEELMVLYNDAITSKDMAKMQDLQTKAQDLAAKGQTFTNVSAADGQKLQEYTKKKATEMQAIISKAYGQ